MTHLVLIDFDDVDDVERVWSEHARIRALRDQDPELLSILENLLPHIDPDTAVEIREALAITTPNVVLAEWFDVFYAAKETKPRPPVAPDKQWPATLGQTPMRANAEDPTGLIGLVKEMACYTSDLNVITRGAFHIAKRDGIDLDLAEEIITNAIRVMQS